MTGNNKHISEFYENVQCCTDLYSIVELHGLCGLCGLHGLHGLHGLSGLYRCTVLLYRDVILMTPVSSVSCLVFTRHVSFDIADNIERVFTEEIAFNNKNRNQIMKYTGVQ